MNRILLSTAAALMLVGAPALAQQSTTDVPLATEVPAAPETAIGVQVRSNAISDDDLNAARLVLKEAGQECPPGYVCIPEDDWAANPDLMDMTPTGAIGVMVERNRRSDPDATAMPD